jgi:hypothetical protein
MAGASIERRIAGKRERVDILIGAVCNILGMQDDREGRLLGDEGASSIDPSGHDFVCQGVWGKNLRRYGWDEFVPIDRSDDDMQPDKEDVTGA